MPIRLFNRLNVSTSIIIIYLSTLFLTAIAAFKNLHSAAVALLLASIGSILIFTLLKQWESLLKRARPLQAPAIARARELPALHFETQQQEFKKSLSEALGKQKELLETLNFKEQTLHKLETEAAQFSQRIADVHHEFDLYKSTTEEDLRRKGVLLSEYQETINQQRDVIKKKQDQINELETKVRDLNYEVKTLLQLAELGNKQTDDLTLGETPQAYQVDMFEEETPPKTQDLTVKSSEDAAQQLKRCIDIAQKMTGANRFSAGTSRFKDLPIDNRALDMRGLFDTLRCENAGTVIVYSMSEDKILFANNQTTNLIGWSPDKFIKNFSEIVSEGLHEWKRGIGELSSTPTSQARLVMKTKTGQNLLVHCQLGVIPTGVFRNHVIGILYTT